MDLIKGQSRVIIENVQPQVDGGIYPAKRTIGERVDVTADIFGDGHDHIRAHLWYKKEGESDWKIIEMKHQVNDQWLASFYVTEKGNYLFTLVAWMDHFETWYDGFKKKALAKVDVKVEILEGIAFLKKLSGGRNTALIKATNQLSADYDSAIHYVLSEEFERTVHKHPLIEHETLFEKVLTISVEHKKANFSAWYEL